MHARLPLNSRRVRPHFPRRAPISIFALQRQGPSDCSSGCGPDAGLPVYRHTPLAESWVCWTPSSHPVASPPFNLRALRGQLGHQAWEAEWRRLWHTYDPVLARVYGPRVPSAELEDLLQDIRVRTVLRIHQYAGGASLGTWIDRVARSVFLNQVRAAKRAAQHALQAVAEQEQSDIAVDPQELAALRDLCERCLHALSARDQDFMQRVLDGWTHAMLAQHYGYAHPHTSVVRSANLRAKLRQVRATLDP